MSIIYKVFNPLNGVHETYSNLSEAETRKLLIIEEYKNHHTLSEISVPGNYIFKQDFISDYVLAYNFMQTKLNGEIFALTSDSQILPTDSLFGYRHTVYNVTTSSHWSRTFSYEYADAIWHIKVKDNVITDWYKNTTSINLADGQEYFWTTFDLVSNLPIEQYSKYSDNIMAKYSLVDPSLPAVLTNFVNINNQLPADVIQQLTASNFPGNMDTIMAYSYKEYGLILEYDEGISIYTDKADWPDWAKQESATLLQQEISKVIADSVQKVYVAEVELDETTGIETWK